MEKSYNPIDHKAYIRYLRKVTGEQIDIRKIQSEVMSRITDRK